MSTGSTMQPQTIPVNSLVRHIAPLQSALANAANEVIGSGYFVLGPSVVEFEQAFAAYCGTTHCVSVANGTDALELSLRALDIGEGDRVVVVANAAMYGTAAAIACGAEPVFVDTLVDDATIDPAALENILAGTSGIKAVIVTHLYGRLARMDAIVAMCAAHGISIVEDCAQAHGAADAQGRRAGSLGAIASFSFYPTKNLGALGDGGAVVTSDAALADKVRKLRQYGWTQKYTNSLKGGRNSRLDEMQARLLLVMLPLLDGWNARRRDIANRYSREITNVKLRVPAISGAEYVGHLYVVRCDDREALRQHLGAEQVQSDVHYPNPDHRQPCHDNRFANLTLPNTEADARTVLTLPCFPELSDDEVSRVIEACNRF